jgi:anti-sigma regulatory factor (Ser/Thr protein kinase)
VADRATRSARRPETARIALPRTAASVGAARRFIQARTAAWSFPEPAGSQLVLIGSELVTNAVLHARTELTLTLELRGVRVRISVMDGSQAPATLRHYQADALTGRGLAVVAALSDRWGISAAPDGKVVWAEVDGGGGQGAGPSPPDLRDAPPAPDAGGDPGSRTVRFPAVPVDGYLALQAHNDALFRELELISIELETGAARVAAPLAELVDQLYWRFRGQRDSYRDVVAAAQDRGETTVDLETTASPAAAPAVREVKALRRWFVEEMVAQL